MKVNIQASRPRASAARGFTLLEMVIVLGIIALILGAAITFSTGIGGTARDQAARANIQEIMTKLEAYRVDAGRYPTEQQGLEALVERPSMAPAPNRWRRQFRKLPVDPWGEEYIYRNPGRFDNKTFEVFSKGENKEVDAPGDPDYDDISSQELD